MISLIRKKKGQIAPFLLVAALVLILTIPALWIVGQAGFTRVRLSNVGDSATVSAGAGMCRALNQVYQINLGGGGLMIHWISLQVFLIARAPWENFLEPWVQGYVINSLIASENLASTAEDICDDVPKNIRQGLYATVFGSSLVDEPKPYIDIIGGNPRDSSSLDEILRSPDVADGRIVYINNDKWREREFPFEPTWRSYRAANLSGWQNVNVLSYSYSVSAAKVKASGYQGRFGAFEPDQVNYEAYVRAEPIDMPDVTPNIMPMIMVYLFWQQIGPYRIVLPGFMPEPWAFVRSISISHKTYGLKVSKSVTYTIPFFSRRVTLQHISKVKVSGSVWSNFTFKLAE